MYELLANQDKEYVRRQSSDNVCDRARMDELKELYIEAFKKNNVRKDMIDLITPEAFGPSMFDSAVGLSQKVKESVAFSPTSAHQHLL